MKTRLLYSGLFLLTLAACRKDQSAINSNRPGTEQPGTVIPKDQINAFIRQSLSSTGHFKWANASDEMVWSALVQGDSVLSVGYQPATYENLARTIHQVDLNDDSWKQAHQQVLNIVLANEGNTAGQRLQSPVVLYDRKTLPIVDVKVGNLATLKALRASNLVRYAEPIGYGQYMEEASSDNSRAASSLLNFGCGSNDPFNGLVAGSDYSAISPNAKQSWNYSYHNIPQAWTRSTGAGIKVMIIDTGLSPNQPAFGSGFNQGASSGRTIQKLVTFAGGTPDDLCGHGTSMAGALAAPRGNNGNTAGIAYNSNLVMVHAAENVVLLSDESVNGVADAYVLAGNDPALKIVSMSLGTIFDFSAIEDGIRYAYNKGKLIFCAAGTSSKFFGSFVGVIFPATMSEVYAVTGVKDNLTERCGNCHVGPEVAFTVVMEKTSTGRNPLSTAQSGDVPSTVGGSSVATASCAGIAALVWSKNPTYPRDSIVARMRRAASFGQNRHNKFGWGNVDANLAVGQ